MDTNGIPSIDKYRLDKNSIDIYGEFKNVKLSDEEYKKIKEKNLQAYIDKLSSYMESTGKRYKSHYATILNWSRKDNANKPEWFDKKIENTVTKKEQEEMDTILKEIGE